MKKQKQECLNQKEQGSVLTKMTMNNNISRSKERVFLNMITNTIKKHMKRKSKAKEVSGLQPK